MEFDTADLASMLSNGTLLGVIEHEMGHVLGIGTIWTDKGLLVGAGTSNPLFVGAQAKAAYNAIFGTNAAGVPVENTGGSGTRDSHWRESVFGSELMTGWVGPGSRMPISRITVASLADLGYSVNMAAADSFTPAIAASGSLLASTTTSSSGGSTGVQSAAIAPTLLNDAELHDAVLSLLARHDAHSNAIDNALSTVSRHSHEAATDVLLTNWSALDLGVRNDTGHA
jgi:hypothetical protein